MRSKVIFERLELLGEQQRASAAFTAIRDGSSLVREGGMGERRRGIDGDIYKEVSINLCEARGRRKHLTV